VHLRFTLFGKQLHLSLLLDEVLLDSLRHQLLSLYLLLQLLNRILQLRLHLLIQAILARLRTLNLPLHVLDVQFGFNFSLIDCFFLFQYFVVVLELLFCGLILCLALSFSDLFYLNIQVFFDSAQNFKLLLLRQANRNLVAKALKF
jgi:hypothetical protein